MERIIYSKFSNDRKSEYKIRTDIVQDDKGKRSVRKYALSSESREHIRRISEYGKLLSKQFSDSILSFNKGELFDDYIELEYVEGSTLSMVLDELLEKSDTDSFLLLLKKFEKALRTVADKSFCPEALEGAVVASGCNDSFIDVFGEAYELKNGEFFSMPLNDIDLIFDNIIVADDKWTVLDYEWSFPIPVPVDFILFRCAHYYSLRGRERTLYEKGIDIYTELGIDKRYLECFENMEKAFQAFVKKGHESLADIKGNSKNQIIYPVLLHESEINRIEKLVFSTVFEYKDEEKLKVHDINVIREKGHIIPIDENVCDIRTDETKGFVRYVIEADVEKAQQISIARLIPGRRSCYARVVEFKGIYENGESYDIAYAGNGRSTDNIGFSFLTDEPQLWTDDFRDGVKKLRIVIDIVAIPEDGLCVAFEKMEEIDRLRSEIWAGESLIKELKESNEKYAAKLDSITASLSWKITKPIRSVKNKFGGRE